MPILGRYPTTSGAGSASNGGATTAILAAPGTGKRLYLRSGVVSVTVAATGGSGMVTLKDGSTVIQRWDANALGSYPFDYGEIGYPLSLNSALNLVVESAVTNQATAFCSLSGWTVGA